MAQGTLRSTAAESASAYVVVVQSGFRYVFTTSICVAFEKCVVFEYICNAEPSFGPPGDAASPPLDNPRSIVSVVGLLCQWWVL